MTNDIKISRELLEQALSGEKVRPTLEGRNNTCIGCGNWMPYGHQEAHEHEDGCPEEIAAKRRHWTSQIRALLAAPVVESQEPVAWMTVHPNGMKGLFFPSENIDPSPYDKPLYTSPPAPVAVVLPERNTLNTYNSHDWDEGYTDGWGAYDAELKRLNPSL